MYTKELREILAEEGISLNNFVLHSMEEKACKSNKKIEINGTKITVYGKDFVATGIVYNRNPR